MCLCSRHEAYSPRLSFSPSFVFLVNYMDWIAYLTAVHYSLWWQTGLWWSAVLRQTGFKHCNIWLCCCLCFKLIKCRLLYWFWDGLEWQCQSAGENWKLRRRRSPNGSETHSVRPTRCRWVGRPVFRRLAPRLLSVVWVSQIYLESATCISWFVC